ncbi:hypothetical protein [Enterobacter roggenkampii]|uniref:hypothetical protein n=1 Tax=Enterobacter roggenkampii TaxID=1812935 RepID=UPI0021D01A85|nr:hypothetical protein [Enterobacter roggenkampii]MCU6180755.1 hypothetical protein [Enterobacter roggenkampii]
MVNVTQESLAKKIKRLESLSNAEYALGLTINEEYQLAAYRMLLKYLSGEDGIEAKMESGNG